MRAKAGNKKPQSKVPPQNVNAKMVALPRKTLANGLLWVEVA
jgi:hypothetical protein